VVYSSRPTPPTGDATPTFERDDPRPLSEEQLDADNLDYFRHPFPYRDLEQGVFLEQV
jgi:hypothetical protein